MHGMKRALRFGPRFNRRARDQVDASSCPITTDRSARYARRRWGPRVRPRFAADSLPTRYAASLRDLGWSRRQCLVTLSLREYEGARPFGQTAVGLDVAKSKVDACIRSEDLRLSPPSTPEGRAGLVRDHDAFLRQRFGRPIDRSQVVVRQSVCAPEAMPAASLLLRRRSVRGGCSLIA
jgi:hypothetical protein